MTLLAMFSLWSTAEHLLVLTTFLFPPLTGLVILVLCIALFGKSLGIRMWYIKTLIRVFEVIVEFIGTCLESRVPLFFWSLYVVTFVTPRQRKNKIFSS